MRVFSDILERARNRPIIDVEEDSVTVGQMIQFLARRLTMEDRPVALRRMLSHTKSERALIAMFLALLELVRLQAILLRQDRHFSEIFIKKHTGFDALMNQGLARPATTGARVAVITYVIIGRRRGFRMATTTKVIAIGNSAGIILPKEALERLNVRKGDSLFLQETSSGLKSPLTTRSSTPRWKWPSA